jgi:hypothetical protein
MDKDEREPKTKQHYGTEQKTLNILTRILADLM